MILGGLVLGFIVLKNVSKVCWFMLLVLLEKQSQSSIPDGRHPYVQGAIAQRDGDRIDCSGKGAPHATGGVYEYFMPENASGSIFTNTSPVVISGSPRSRSCRLA